MMPGNNTGMKPSSSNDSSLVESNKKRIKLEQPMTGASGQPTPPLNMAKLPGNSNPMGQQQQQIPSGLSRPNQMHSMHTPHHHSGGMMSTGGSATPTNQHYYNQPQQSESKLFSLSSIESKDSYEVAMEDAYNKLQHLISPGQTSNQPEGKLFDELSKYANQSRPQSDEVSNALLYSMLIDPVNRAKSLQYIFLCQSSSFSQPSESGGASTSLGLVISNLLTITTESYNKLFDVPRKQLLWILREFTKAKVSQFDRILLQMIRNIQSGCLSEKNVWLAEAMLDILFDRGSSPASAAGMSGNNPSVDQPVGSMWIYTFNELMTQSLYTYLRIIPDHSLNPMLAPLRQRETDFCIQVLRERWMECTCIGRDLIRLLQNVAKIPEFEQLWKDMTQNPQVLSPQFAQFGGLLTILRTMPRRRCLISRLTVDMERKIYFLITNVKAGHQKRYLDWFQRQYLNTPESQSLRVDILRYVCAVVHPSNEMLSAGLTPRWTVCLWLLNTCSSPAEFINIKLALFYDWLFYDAKKDNIMLIEPAILLMFNAMRVGVNAMTGVTGNVSLTGMLFDFLCRIGTNYFTPFKEQVLNGIMQSFKDSCEKKVIPSLQIFFVAQIDPKTQLAQPPPVDRDLRALVQATFGTFFQTLNLNQPSIAAAKTPTTPEPTIPSPTPSPLVNIGSTTSLFKQKSTGVDDGLPPVVLKSSMDLLSTSIKTETTFSPLIPDQFKPEPEMPPAIKITTSVDNNMSATFSDDEDDEEASNHSDMIYEDKINTKPAPTATIPFKSNTPNQLLVVNPSPSPLVSSIQAQLQQFVTKPFKVYTSVDDIQTMLTSLNSGSVSSAANAQSVNTALENSLNLIASDDVRDKLMILSDSCKDYYSSLASTGSNLYSSNNSTLAFITIQFKSILDLACKDPEYQVSFNSSLSDLAVCLANIFRYDFANNLLPGVFYTNLTAGGSASSANTGSGLNNSFSIGSSSNQFSKMNDIDLISGAMFNPNNYANLVNETIQQRPVFLLFKELAHTTNQSNEREVLVHLLNEIYSKQNRIGYYFLYYIYSVMIKSRFGISNSTLSSSSSSITSAASKSNNDLVNLVRIYKEFMSERSNASKNSTASAANKHGDNVEYDKVSASSSSSTSLESLSSSDSAVSSDEEDRESRKLKSIMNESEVNIGNCLMQDLRLCQQDDPYLFCFLLPLVLSQDLLPNYVVNNSDLIYLIVSCIDSRLLKDLISSIISQDLILINHKDENESSGGKSSTKGSKTRGSKKTTPLNSKKRKRKDSDTETSKSTTTPNKKGASALSQLKMSKSMKKKQKFKKETLIDVLNASLNWETIEQIFFWEILMAHECVSLNYLLPVFNRLDANKHSEAVCHLFQLIKSTEPSYDLVKLVVQRREEDNLARALLINWCRQRSDSNRMIQIFVKLINKSASVSNQSQTQLQSPHNKPESTYKKITVGSSINNNKVKLTAQQQLEQIEKQKRLNAQHQGNNNNNNSSLILIDQEDLNKTPSLDQVLGHLNKIRLNQSCINFMLNESLIDVLRKIYNKHLNDELKKKYSDLFTLADQFEERDDVNKSMSEISSESENDDDDDSDENESGGSNKSGSENEKDDGKRKSTARGSKSSGKARQQSKKQVRSVKSNKTTRKSANKSVKSSTATKTTKKNTRSSKAATSDVSNESSNEDDDAESSSSTVAGDDKNETEKVTETENTSGSSSSSATSSEDEYSAKSKKSASSKAKRTSGNKAGRPRKKPKHQSNKSDNDSE